MLADETTPHKYVVYSLITIDVLNVAHLISLLAYKDYFWINCQQKPNEPTFTIRSITPVFSERQLEPRLKLRLNRILTINK
ncbi:Uncharacterised protein [Legionella sainthelensi]|nr:Uncharacterised protein [Legionella sainthelensi]